jgi:hypothetical protein
MMVVVPSLAKGERRKPGEIAGLIAGGEWSPTEEVAKRVDAEGHVMQEEHPHGSTHNNPVSPPTIEPVSATPSANGTANPTVTQTGKVRLMKRRSQSATRSLA